ncbi:MAG: amidohydrolase family protein [Actinobacteria bacterium]|nr:amidohydrolase family protein [Actinomycetota bacterium]
MSPAPRPERIVDAHVHLWDPARTDWYPYLRDGDRLGMGDVTGMARRFDVEDHRRESGDWPVVGIVNVAAATGQHSVEETLELDRRADEGGAPHAIVGGLPPHDTVADAVAAIDRQMGASRFRGVRPMGGSPDPLPAGEVLDALAERDLVFEVMTHPDRLAEVAAVLARRDDDLTVVVEHAGWPRSADDAEFALWRDGMTALADVGPNVICKISGLAMPLGTISADAYRPWVEHVLTSFGPDRCMVASNFPVDGMHGTLDALWSTFAELLADLDEEARDQVFATTAERTYRI